MRFSARRLDKLTSDRERLVDLYLDADIDDTYRDRKARIEAEIEELETRLGDRQVQLDEPRGVIQAALGFARRCRDGYKVTPPDARRAWNQAFLGPIIVKDHQIIRPGSPSRSAPC